MLQRLTRTVALVMLLTAVASQPVAAWSNGPWNGNGYGTHDWILDNAIRMAGDKGAWVDRSAALLATDDPDSERTDSAYHLFRDQGISRGAPEETARLYALAVAAYQSGDRKSASHYLGVLSHYYSDVLVPFHADYRPVQNDSLYGPLHADFERMVDEQHINASSRPEWAEAGPARKMTDVRARVVSAAYFSRSRFGDLVAAMSVSKSVYDPTVNKVTKEVLSRATNDLADLIASVPTGTGLSKPPAKITPSISKSYPARNTTLTAYARCVDDSGDPVEGAAVRFVWPLAGGVRTFVAYTDANGQARSSMPIGSEPLMRKVRVLAVSTMSSAETSASTWFMPTPVLADGRSGIKTSVNNYRPRQRTTVTVSTLVRDRYGRPVAGLPLTFTWRHPGKTVTYKTVTDSRGIAKHARNIGSSPKGKRVYVRAQVQSGGIRRSSTASFVPR